MLARVKAMDKFALNGASGSRGFCQACLADSPLVQFAARGAMDAHSHVADSHKRNALSLDAAVNLPSSHWANEHQVFHRIPSTSDLFRASSCRNDTNANAPLCRLAANVNNSLS
jgi:hypothetical protein